jgi:Flp pilus assembly protein TadG
VSASRRLRGDRGAALVELAMVVPLLALLVFGTIELGQAWVADREVDAAVASAARVAAARGSVATADRDALLALRAALPADQLAAADRVVIFDASTTGTVPAACLKPKGSSSQVGAVGCNSYSGATLRSVTATSMAGFGPTGADRYWAPSARPDTLAGPPAYVGVWLRTEHRGVSGLWFAHVEVTASAVYRIEPDVDG